MATYDNQPPVEGWCVCVHRPAPCMTAPEPEPREDHLIRGTE